MEPLIYYPRFEPPSENWMKFALLYFEEFKPIVPYEKRRLLSDGFTRIMDETDLVALLDPGYTDGYSASIRAIDEAEHILSNTYDRSPQFREINLARKWRNPDNWTFLLRCATISLLVPHKIAQKSNSNPFIQPAVNPA